MRKDWRKEPFNKKLHWHGVDLDGTLAYWDGSHGGTKIGKPIPAIVRQIQQWLDRGEEVRIFTARVDDRIQVLRRGQSHPLGKVWWRDDQKRKAIAKYTRKLFGKPLEATNSKDRWMYDLLDDRAEGIQTNTGKKKSTIRAARVRLSVPRSSPGWQSP